MVTRFDPTHAEAVARLHVATLTGLLALLGLPAARAYYRGCARSAAAVGFVWLEAGEVRGFVMGTASPARLKADIAAGHRAATVAALLWGLLRRPSALPWLLRSLLVTDARAYDRDAPELVYLAVAPTARAAGVGRRLVDAFTGALGASGVPAYELSVDEDNASAIAFYERLGFRRVGRYHEFGADHRRYRLG